MNYYPHHIGDFNNATRHLSRVERSVYRDLIELYYDTESALLPAVDRLCRLVVAHSDEERTAVQQVLNEFFTETEHGWVHDRCEQEIAKYHGNKEAKSAAGRASAAARAAALAKNKPAAEANNGAASQQPFNSCSTEPQRNSTNQNQNHNQKEQDQKPLSPPPAATGDAKPSKKPPKFDPLTERPVNVTAAAWADWCAHRKKSGLTEKACQLIAGKLAGHPNPDAVLYHSIQNGWTGLFPEQITHENGTQNRAIGRLSAVDQVKQAIAARESRSTREAASAADRQAMAENDRDVRPPLDGEFRHVG